jgi:hypothetical protein
MPRPRRRSPPRNHPRRAQGSAKASRFGLYTHVRPHERRRSRLECRPPAPIGAQGRHPINKGSQISWRGRRAKRPSVPFARAFATTAPLDDSRPTREDALPMSVHLDGKPPSLRYRPGGPRRACAREGCRTYSSTPRDNAVPPRSARNSHAGSEPGECVADDAPVLVPTWSVDAAPHGSPTLEPRGREPR